MRSPKDPRTRQGHNAAQLEKSEPRELRRTFVAGTVPPIDLKGLYRKNRKITSADVFAYATGMDGWTLARMILVSATPRLPEPARAMMRVAALAEHSAEEWAAMRAVHVHGDAHLRGGAGNLRARGADVPGYVNENGTRAEVDDGSVRNSVGEPCS